MNNNDIFPAKAYDDYLLSVIKQLTVEHGHIEHMIKAHKAYCLMLNEENILPAKKAQSIMRSLINLDTKKDYIIKRMATDEDEDLFFCLENIMIADTDIDTAGALHTGRSRNDLGHTMFRMSFREHYYNILQLTKELAESFIKRGEQGFNEIIVAWTHCQPAQPTTYAHYLGALVEVSLNNLQRMVDAFEESDKSPYGAAAITTTGFPINRDTLADLLGFNGVALNSYGAIGSCDYSLNVMGIIKNLAIHLGRFCDDMLNWARLEIRQIDMPDGWVQSSSIMPQKRNVVVFEHLRSRFSRIASLADVPAGTIKSTPFGDIDDIEVEYHQSIHAVFDQLEQALPLLTAAVYDIKTKPENINELIDKSCILATELADNLVKKTGISFRQAHKVAAKAAKYSIKTKTAFSQISGEKIAQLYQEVTGNEIPLKVEEITSSVCAANFISSRNVKGGPGEVAIKEAYNIYNDKLADLQKQIHSQQVRHENANKKLEQMSTDFANSSNI